MFFFLIVQGVMYIKFLLLVTIIIEWLQLRKMALCFRTALQLYVLSWCRNGAALCIYLLIWPICSNINTACWYKRVAVLRILIVPQSATEGNSHKLSVFFVRTGIFFVCDCVSIYIGMSVLISFGATSFLMHQNTISCVRDMVIPQFRARRNDGASFTEQLN